VHTPTTTYPSAFIVAGSAYAAALRNRLGEDASVVVFCESESLVALRAILTRPPKVLALDTTVVRTARGALLVSRLKEHAVEVRVLINGDDNMPLLLSQPHALLHTVSQPLQGCGTRVAHRFPMTDKEVVVDGERSQLVNLSVTGAQVVLPARLQPRQSIRFTLLDGSAEIRFRAQVAWSSLELMASAIRYRVGITFTDPDKKLLEVFCNRHGQA
jgi:PilZ domain-containing protein